MPRICQFWGSICLGRVIQTNTKVIFFHQYIRLYVTLRFVSCVGMNDVIVSNNQPLGLVV